jgi:23S rRNA (uracil1939-C5)-methyltransferase
MVNINDKIEGEIIGQENSGQGYLKLDGFIIFVENGLKGDVGQILITEVKKNYARGKMIVFDKLSDERVLPPCPYYEECGGCQLQHQDYISQLKFKELKVKMALEHIALLKDIKINPIISGDDYYYRNKVTLRVDGNKLGFYKHDTNTLVDIEKCIICDDKINEVIKYLKDYINDNPNHNIKLIMIRHSNYNNELMLSVDNITKKKNFISFITNKVSNIGTIIINNKVEHGNGYIKENINDMIFNISALSFFQVNTRQVEKLYKLVIDYASLTKKDKVLDLYCGTGTITCLLSKYCHQILGIEVIEDAIKDAKDNAINNNVSNIEFIVGKVEDNISKLLDHHIDTIVLDPPRKGSDTKTLSSIIKINPNKIIYVSCSPTTLARDLKYLLSNNYKIEEITPVDMFPETEHVECVVKLIK